MVDARLERTVGDAAYHYTGCNHHRTNSSAIRFHHFADQCIVFWQ